jgi:hypothetical protein
MVKPHQAFPDVYSVPVKIQAKKVNTNYRYRHFTQTHFTAGDEEQFEQYRHKTACTPFKISSISEDISIWNQYQVNSQTVQQTFRYIFYKFKKGIFIQIRNGRVVNFSPFSNTFFVNEWSDRIHVPPVLQNQSNILPKSKWYSNNGLFRYESPCNETDTGTCQVKHMFEEICRTYSIPDLDFFVNRRDFPLLKTDGTEPYHHIWDSETHPLVSHQYDHYAPVLSSCTREGFADIPIPTMDDWTRVCFKENIHFAMNKRVISTSDIFNTPWYKKRELAVFRGSSTGIGYNAENNMRIRLCEQFQNHPYCNVGITSWSNRYRKYQGEPILRIPESTLTLSGSLNLEEQSMYKYIIHIEGHVQAYRLSIELAMRSVILLVESKYKLWFQDRLVPWVHYVPVQSDLSDLDEKIQWCLEHDDECKKIAEEARLFYDTWLSKKSCLEYLKNILCKIAYQCVRKTNIQRETLTQRYIQQHYLRKQPKTNYKIQEFILDEVFKQQDRLRRRTCFQNNNTTVVLYDDKFVHKKSKYANKFDHEQFIGVFCVNRILRCIPNFVYTIPNQKTNQGMYLEYIPGITLFDYIKSSQFSLNEWMFYMIQSLLSISVAQRICFFTHHDLCPWNIILKPCESEQIIDYLVDINQLYRVYSTCVPVIIDYDKSHAVYDLQSFKHFFEYQPYQDALCLLISCVYNIVRYQKLTPSDQKTLLFILKQSITDPIYCPSLESFEDMRFFLNDAHKYSHISFSNKGELERRTPQSLIQLFINQYRPNYCSQSRVRVINCVEKVESILHTNIHRWKTFSIHPLPKCHPFLMLYQKQLFETELDEEPDRDPITMNRLIIPIIQRQSSMLIYPSKTLEFLNILCELVSHGGNYQLLDSEKKTIIPQIQNYLKDRQEIYLYSKVLINFKLSRNIL